MDRLFCEKKSLSKYVDNLQSQGRYTFTKIQALQALQCQETSFDRSVRRLEQKRRIAVIKPGFLVIVPIEYKSWGSIPPDWFIKDLMQYLELPYYVGLLSAAALYGAAHQQPQQFQIITDRPVRRIQKGKANIWFFKKLNIKATPIQEIQTQTGLMRVSAPEATALDLVKFYKRAGHLSNIATVLSELAESMDGNALINTAKTGHYEWPVIQRLGYLLSCEGVNARHLAEPLAQWIAACKPRFVPLAPYKKHDPIKKDGRWRIYINESIEVDV